MTILNEDELRAMVREHYKATGDLELHKQFPLDSVEKAICLEESRKIYFEEQQADHSTHDFEGD